MSAGDSIEVVPASDLPTARLAETFSAGYEGYRYPVQLDEAGFLAMRLLWDLDLERSRVALEGGEPVGLCLIGVRGGAGWIGGLGISAAARRRGLGRRLLEAVLAGAAAHGIPDVSLEVLEPNTGAIALYERLGFETTRLLEIWVLEEAAPASRAVEVPLEQAHAWIRAHRSAPEPWQRSDESLARLVENGAALHGLAAGDEGAAIIRGGGPLSVVQLGARSPEAAEELLAAGRALGSSLRYVNVPEGDPASPALRELGAKLEMRQLEMRVVSRA